MTIPRDQLAATGLDSGEAAKAISLDLVDELRMIERLRHTQQAHRLQGEHAPMIP